jgi:serine/threonine protein kinase
LVDDTEAGPPIYGTRKGVSFEEMSDAPRVGTELAGYLIEGVVGRGGMSTVYRAENRRLGNRVALKILSADLAADETFRERFVRESRVAASISHPNIIPIYDAGSVDDNLYIAMRYVEGGDLKQLLARAGPLPIDVAVSIVCRVGRALAAAHVRGLIHRDVKPANILLEFADGDEPSLAHPYVADFGLTKHLGSVSGVTGTGQLIGTLDYVSPEQISGEDLDGRTDVYSLGCVLYECLAGRVPFSRPGDAAVLWAHMSEAPVRLSELREDVTSSVDAVVSRAMAKDKDERFATCGELVAALDSASDTTALIGTRPIALPVPLEPTSFPPVPPTGGDREPATHNEPGRWSRRKIAVAVGVLTLAAAGVAAATRFSHDGGRGTTTPTVSHAPLTDLQRSVAGIVSLRTCQPPTTASGVETIVCTDPTSGITQVSVQQYTTWRYLYANYTRALKRARSEDTDLGGLNSGLCGSDRRVRRPTSGPVWEHEGAWTLGGNQHGVALTEQAMTANSDQPLNADGRVFCWTIRIGQPEIVWTDNKDGYLMATAIGSSTYPSLAAWWDRAHTLLAPASGAPQ